MIGALGTALHLAARAIDCAREAVSVPRLRAALARQQEELQRQWTIARELQGALERERDQARMDAAHWRGTAATLERDASEVRATAQAFLSALDHGDCDLVFPCDADSCSRLATRKATDRCLDFCDEHAETSEARAIDRNYAPSLRTLRAALAPEGGRRG